MSNSTATGGNIMDSALRSVADRLGFLAYALIVSGGRPDWQVILGETPRDDDSSGGEPSGHRSPQDPFTDTVPLQDIDRETELVGGY
jgi:hypothetical protein